MRLIDADELKKALSEPLYRSTIKDFGEVIEYTHIMNTIDNAPTVEPDMEFAEWVAQQIFYKELSDDLFVELACRKLEKLGLVEKTESEWIKRGEE